MDFQQFAEAVAQLTQQGQTPFRDFRSEAGMVFRVLVDTSPGRNHLVIVRGGNTGMGDFVVCTAFGLKLPKDRDLTAEMGMDLLRRNGGQAIGSWCVVDGDDGGTWIALNESFMLDQVKPHWACTMIQMLASTADSFEAELGRDEY